MELDRVRARITQLMKVARNSAATEGEVENALRAARNLILEYHLSEESLEEASSNDSSRMDQAATSSKFARFAYWEKALVCFVNELIGGIDAYLSQSPLEHVEYVNGPDDRTSSVVFYGVQAEARLAAETYYSLSTDIVTSAYARYGSAFRGDGCVYALGYVYGLSEQLRSVNEEDSMDAAQGPGTDIAVRSRDIEIRKRERARQWLREHQNLRLKKSSKRPFRSTGSHHAHAAGVRDGQNHDLSGSTDRRSAPETQRQLPHFPPT